MHSYFVSFAQFARWRAAGSEDLKMKKEEVSIVSVAAYLPPFHYTRRVFQYSIVSVAGEGFRNLLFLNPHIYPTDGLENYQVLFLLF